MDLIHAHKRVMKISELSGLSLSVQTIFATAVSEIARAAIEKGEEAKLSLGIEFLRGNKKQLQAIVSDRKDFCDANSESIIYARRLADSVLIEQVNGRTQVTLGHSIPLAGLITDLKIQSFIAYFENERPLSPYDELRRKNIQLEEMAFRLRESENNYTQLTNSLPLMMFSAENSGKVIYTNKWFRDFLGFHVSQLNAVQCQPFLHPEDYEDLFMRWNKSKDNFAAFHGQVRLKNVDSGQYIWHLISILPIKTDMGTTTQWNGFLVDIHAQKMIEQTLKDNSELKATQQKLEYYQEDLKIKIVALNQSNNDLEQFASIASHDLQEPLRKIRIFVSLLQQDMDNRSLLEKHFVKIDSAAERMTLLIKGVLDYSRITNQALHFEQTDLNEIIKQLENDFEALIQQKEAVILYANLPTVNGLPIQLHQLFSNLLSNALKFTAVKPVITISAWLVSAQEVSSRPELNPDYAYVQVNFQDNGIGFEQQYSEKVFTIFQQLHHRQAYGGTGIGLALCKKIAERHHGLITVNSQPGEGASFQIYLPLSN